MKTLSAFLIVLFHLTGISQTTVDTLKINEFKSLKVNGKINVVLHKGTPLIVVKSKYAYDRQDLEMKTKGDQLRLSLIKSDYKDKEPTLHIYCETFDFLKATGNATIKSEEQWAIKNLELDVQAGGHVNLNVSSTLIKGQVSQGGKLTLFGKSELAKLSVSTGGVIAAFNLKAEHAEAKINAGGEIFVRSSESLTANVKAGGTILFEGNPKILNQKTSLGGKITASDKEETDK